MRLAVASAPKRFRHIFLDAEGTLYVPKKGKSRWEFWANPSPRRALEFFELDNGVAEALPRLREAAETLCLVSLNDKEILDVLLEKFQAREWFDEVLLNGNKGEKISAYLADRGLRREDALMVGDMPSLDLYPVWRAGVEAILVNREYNRNARAERIRGLHELPSWLRLAELAERVGRPMVRLTTLDEFVDPPERPQPGAGRDEDETKSLIEPACESGFQAGMQEGAR